MNASNSDINAWIDIAVLGALIVIVVVPRLLSRARWKRYYRDDER